MKTNPRFLLRPLCFALYALLSGHYLAACSTQTVAPDAPPAVVTASSQPDPEESALEEKDTKAMAELVGLTPLSAETGTTPPLQTVPIDDLVLPVTNPAAFISTDFGQSEPLKKLPDDNSAQELDETQEEISIVTWRAERGHAASQLMLGQAYLRGNRVPQDFERARLWLELASMQGDHVAQYELGSLHYTGQGVRKDYINAREWWLESAINGNSDAQQKLGYLYSEGLGVNRDFARARNWYLKAANLGHSQAQTLLGSLYHEGERLPQDYAEAIKWYRLAALQGHPHAQYTLGTLYHDGLGTETDYIKCAAWVDLALDSGYPDELDAGTVCRNYLDEQAQAQADTLASEWKASIGTHN